MNTPSDAALYELMRRFQSLPDFNPRDYDISLQYDAIYTEFRQHPLGCLVIDHEASVHRIANGLRTLRDYKTWSTLPVDLIKTTKEEIERERKKRNAIKKQIGAKKLEIYERMYYLVKSQNNKFNPIPQV